MDPAVLLTDRTLVLKKLVWIETCVQELRTLARPAEIRHDVREERFVERTLQIAIQAALDVASHVIADERLGEPKTNRETFTLLERHGWLSRDLASSLSAMAGLRNILVYEYDSVDLTIVEEIVHKDLDDLLAFVSTIRTRLGS